MSDDLKEIKPEYPDEALQQSLTGRQFVYAPIQALTAVDSTAIGTGSGGSYVADTAATTIANMRTRINEIEAALIKLGLLKHI